MPGKRHLIRRIHWTRSYTTTEAAETVGADVLTVRRWIQEGLPIVAGSDPFLILGADLRAFITARRAARKKPCAADEMYCLRCRTPRTAAAGTVTIETGTARGDWMRGRCAVCGASIHRRLKQGAQIKC